MARISGKEQARRSLASSKYYARKKAKKGWDVARKAKDVGLAIVYAPLIIGVTVVAATKGAYWWDL